MTDLTLLAVMLAATTALAAVLHRLLLPVQDRPGRRLDTKGLLLFGPLVVLFVAGAPEEALLPIMAALGVYLFVAVTDVLGTPRITRVAFVVLVAVVVATQGIRIESIRLPGTSTYYELGWASWALTALWLLLCSALFGRAGSIPSVSFGVAALSGVTFYIVCLLVPWATGETATARIVALAVVGVSLPQLLSLGMPVSAGQPPGETAEAGRGTGQAANASSLRRTASPSSYATGFLIGSLAVIGALKHTASLAVLLPLLVISVPLFGATFAYAAALRDGWRAMHIGQRRRHLHELLLEQGYSQSQVFSVLIGVAAYMCVLGVVLVLLTSQPFWVKLLVLLGGISTGPFIFFVILRMLRHEGPLPVRAEPVSINLFNVRLHAVTMEQALAQAESFVREGGPHMIVTSDTSTVIRAQDDEELRAIINEADLATVDGTGVVVAARMLNLPLSGRVAGVDMMQALCEIATRLDAPVYLLGAQPGVPEEAAARLAASYPGLKVAGCQHGYFAEEKEREVVEAIKAAKPAVLFVAMGIPKQEKWIKRHLRELGVPVCMGVGGSFDVIAGRVKRAPEWMRCYGLEWLYRTLKQPRRLPRLAALPRMFLMTVHTLLLSPERPDSGEVEPDLPAEHEC
jgi:N-acetylglucosaminyldiphosphoundecaprenol N-acetyl-beta-D-mannosaminyltransferase